MDIRQLQSFTQEFWESSVLESLQAYIRISCKSPQFDSQWQERGHLDAAMELAAAWCRTHAPPGTHVEIRRLAGRTPLLIVDVPGALDDCVVLYGHLDKQPELSGWDEGLGPWEPVIRDGRLYGRGAADDGYAVFAALTAILALDAQQVPRARCVLLIEASEESSSVDLPAHLDAIAERIGEPSLVICLDADCGDYERLWSTTSLRGLVNGQLRVRVLREGVHSMASGIVPTPFRIVEQLLQRIEELATGRVVLSAMQAPIPPRRLEQIAAAADVLGSNVVNKWPWAPSAHAVSDDSCELLANATWRAALVVTGADGLPPASVAGNVLLPEITLKLSIRIPPTCDAQAALTAVSAALEADSPYGAEVTFRPDPVMQGWHGAEFPPWLEHALSHASRAVFGCDAVQLGSGGSIPFVAMLAQRYPSTPVWVTGVLGPGSNAHGPNEFLHLDYAQRLTASVSLVLCEHGRHIVAIGER